MAELITKGPDVASLTFVKPKSVTVHCCGIGLTTLMSATVPSILMLFHGKITGRGLAKQRDSDSTIYIVESSVCPVGQVRFDRDGGISG